MPPLEPPASYHGNCPSCTDYAASGMEIQLFIRIDLLVLMSSFAGTNDFSITLEFKTYIVKIAGFQHVLLNKVINSSYISPHHSGIIVRIDLKEKPPIYLSLF